MTTHSNLNSERVFKYFEEICSIPHGSGNMDKISDYCMNFAKEHSLKALRDEANNVIIYKQASKGYENSETVILQGHLDMVCQKDEGVETDFEKDPIQTFVEGDYIKAKGTTLGGDDGIAVAMILAILESDSYEHPAIEAVLTTDEEIGMIGAGKLDFSLLSGKRMINIDSENQGVLTVSCAGGSDFEMSMDLSRIKINSKTFKLTVKGLKGGHSGVEIDKGRVNANILMGRILNRIKELSGFGIVSIDGGDKDNAIPVCSEAVITADDANKLQRILEDYISVVSREIKGREEGFEFTVEEFEKKEADIIEPSLGNTIICMLLCTPNGVVEMSAEIDNLVETSLNLGILKTDMDKVTAHFALRSSKASALKFLEERMCALSLQLGFTSKAFGHYPPWEYKKDSFLQKLYKEKYKEKTGKEILVEAIHAGLECGVFSNGLKDLDCISVGPDMQDIHTTREKLSVSSAKIVFGIITDVLKALK